MTNDELKDEWKKYGVILKGGEIFPLKDKYVICWGWKEDWGGLIFDVGDWSGECGVFITDENNNLISVNPLNHSETMVIGKLVKLNPV